MVTEGFLPFCLKERNLCLCIQVGRDNLEIHFHGNISKVIRDIKVIDIDIQGGFPGIRERFCISFKLIGCVINFG